MKRILTLVFFAFSLLVNAQGSTDQQLANLYYNNGEYDKALLYLEKMVAKNPIKFDMFRYVECLEKTNQSKEAEKTLKKYYSQNETDLDFAIALGEFYERNERLSERDKLFDGVIKKNSGSAFQVGELSNFFLRKNKPDWALKALETGKKMYKKNSAFQLQFAQVYGALGRYDEMISSYFEALEIYPNYLEMIETELTARIDFTDEANPVYQKLKEQLLLKIQKNPNDLNYPKMLIWLFTQKKEFKSALVQAQALDKRDGNAGTYVMELAEICVQNQAYAVAKNAYKYVVELGDSKPSYFRAYGALLNVQYREITEERKASSVDIQNAINDYQQALKIIGFNRNSWQIARELAEIQAYYGNQIDAAIESLNNMLAFAGMSEGDLAQVKMTLGDIYVLQNDIWSASLLYMQIDKDFKFETIGSEAKFKNARIFYYDGDFEFAQSQLDILKQSTSKLIANDAMQLSVLITDNYGLDSNFTAMYQFAQADLLLEQHRYEDAFMKYDSIQREFPDHGLADEILFRKAKAFQEQGKWQEAIGYLEQLIKYHGQDILADDAVFQLGEIYEKRLNDPVKAADYYKQILFDYKGSLLTVEARKRYRALRGDKTTEEID